MSSESEKKIVETPKETEKIPDPYFWVSDMPSERHESRPIDTHCSRCGSVHSRPIGARSKECTEEPMESYEVFKYNQGMRKINGYWTWW